MQRLWWTGHVGTLKAEEWCLLGCASLANLTGPFRNVVAFLPPKGERLGVAVDKGYKMSLPVCSNVCFITYSRVGRMQG
jgi:hypothetical protein